MQKNKLNKNDLEKLLPHREPMLLISELKDIVPMKSATGVVNVKNNSFFFSGHFPGQPVMPGVLIVEAFGQAAAALAAHCLDPKIIENKLVFLMTVDKAKFRSPVFPECQLLLKVKVLQIKGKVWKYRGEAFVDDKKKAEAEWMATIADRN